MKDESESVVFHLNLNLVVVVVLLYYYYYRELLTECHFCFLD
jgi:hypothetical protein